MNDTANQDLNSFQQLLQELIDESGESYRQVSQASGLHHTSVSRYLRGTIPGRDACIALADHFGINPNEMLEAAGYEPLRFFEKEEIDLSKVSPEAKLLLDKLERIKEPRLRAQLFEVVDRMLDGYLLAEEAEDREEIAEPKTALESVSGS
jgi:transcriptional regulator with XRE-family HTH domain